jgi:hypothetical protein
MDFLKNMAFEMLIFLKIHGEPEMGRATSYPVVHVLQIKFLCSRSVDALLVGFLCDKFKPALCLFSKLLSILHVQV